MHTSNDPANATTHRGLCMVKNEHMNNVSHYHLNTNQPVFISLFLSLNVLVDVLQTLTDLMSAFECMRNVCVWASSQTGWVVGYMLFLAQAQIH